MGFYRFVVVRTIAKLNAFIRHIGYCEENVTDFILRSFHLLFKRFCMVFYLGTFCFQLICFCCFACFEKITYLSGNFI